MISRMRRLENALRDIRQQARRYVNSATEEYFWKRAMTKLAARAERALRCR